MLQDHFYMRLMLLIAVGIVYVKAYMNMAKRNSKESEPERHLILKILGGCCAVMAVIMGCMGMFLITQISFPQEAIGPYISSNMIIRSSYQTMYWGYETLPQTQCISVFSVAFVLLSLSAYCFMYKSSHSRWYTKVGKVVFCILFLMFFASATDFHYFDFYEWIAPVLFAIMAFFALRNKKDESTESIVEENKKGCFDTVPIHIDENNDSTSNVEDGSKNVPQIDIDQYVLVKPDEDSQKSECNQQLKAIAAEVPSANEVEQVDSSIVNEAPPKKRVDNPATLDQANTEYVIKFCRHCGGKLDYQSDKYCKHCGNQLFK